MTKLINLEKIINSELTTKINNSNISHAAKEAEIDRKYFRKLMKKYEVDVAALKNKG